MNNQNNWVTESACLGVDPALFFPDRSEDSPTSYTEARKVCAECPVRAECLDAAIARHEKFGMFGGLTPPERRRYAKNRHLAATETLEWGNVNAPRAGVTTGGRSRPERSEMAGTKKPTKPKRAARHGTITGYRYDSCRCDACRKAHARHTAEVLRVKKEQPVDPGDPRHGTLNFYNYHGCRCEPCREAKRASNRATGQRDVA